MPVPKTPPSALYDPLFDDAWLKWGWAVQHAKALQAEVLRVLDAYVAQGVSTRAEYEPKFHGFPVAVDSLPRLPETLGLHLGDVLHGFRSALDNAAWAVVQRGRQPPSTLTERQRRKVAFPCVDSASSFRTTVARLVPGARAADLAVIRWAQPYHWPKRSRARHALPFLIEKNNLDKHKTIQPVLLSHYDLVPQAIKPTDCIVRRFTITPPRPMKIGTEIARIYVRKTGSNPSIEMHSYLGATVFLNDELAAEEFLTVTDQWTYEVLSRLSAQPPDLADRVKGLTHG